MSVRKLYLIALLPLAASLFAMPARDNPRQNSLDLRFGLISEPTTLDPLKPSNTADGRCILYNVFEGLVKSNTQGRLVPALAETVEISKDALVYSFILRDAQFHDGSPVSAADAEFSLTEAKNQGFTGLAQIEKITVLGPKNISITLKAPDPDFLPYLTVAIIPKSNPDREKNPIGTGPFMIEKYLPQQEFVLVKNPSYWQSGLPRLERVTIAFAADNNALYTSLEGGNINGAMVSGDVAEKLDPAKYEITSGYSNSVQLLAFNNNVKPFDDVRVRQALSYAMDAKEIIDTAFYGKGEPSGSPLIPGLAVYYNEELKHTYPRNLEKARSLLAEAGYANGFALEIKVPSNYSMHIDTAQVIVNQLAEINVQVSIRLVDWAAWLSDTYRNRNYEATIISLDGPTVSPQSYLARYVSTSGSNFFNYRNENYDRIYSAILKETDEAARIQLYREAQKIISDDAPAFYIQDIYAFKVFSGNFRGALNYPLYIMDFAAIYRN